MPHHALIISLLDKGLTLVRRTIPQFVVRDNPSPFRRNCLAVLLSLVFAWPAFARADQAPAVEGLDAVLDEALKAWQAPGLAVAVVHDDKVIYLKGRGVRQKDRAEPVTPDTIFGIGSLTKAFTATALAQLIDDGKATWDDPVRKHVPFFRLRDALADRDVTLRDLLSHRTGLPRHDLLWYRAPWSLEETLRRAGRLEPATSFRSTYGYNNICYIAAGFALTSAAGAPWNEFMQKRLLEPLELKNAVFTRAQALQAADHASPHRRIDGAVRVIPWYDDDRQVRASGSLKMGVRDLANWLRFQLGDGVFNGKRLVSAANLAETHTSQIPIRADHNAVERDRAETTGSTQMSYGLGWRILEYRGRPLLEHGGAVDGFRARILLLPKERLGVVLLLNLEQTEAATAIGNVILDHLLKLPAKDWHAHYHKVVQQEAEEKQAATKRFLDSRKPGTKPSLPLGDYVGTYEDPAFGSVRIGKEDAALVLSWSSYKATLKHFHLDTFTLEQEQDVLGLSATFGLDADGAAATLQVLGRTFTRK
jgi:CubicO group peptidase (beta-lactamase class C family)